MHRLTNRAVFLEDRDIVSFSGEAGSRIQPAGAAADDDHIAHPYQRGRVSMLPSRPPAL
jgi:hypothetical protein